jgi:hypothetical protein
MKTHELGRSGLVSTTDGKNGHFWRKSAVGNPICSPYKRVTSGVLRDYVCGRAIPETL